MSHHHYNQRLQGQSSRDQYQGQPQLGGWSSGEGQYYENSYQQQPQQQSYGEWKYSQQAVEQYDHSAGPALYREDAYHQAPQAYSQTDGQYYSEQQQTNQQYQYDDRYRTQVQAPHDQGQRRQDRRERRSREKNRAPEMDLKGKSKCRWSSTCHV